MHICQSILTYELKTFLSACMFAHRCNVWVQIYCTFATENNRMSGPNPLYYWTMKTIVFVAFTFTLIKSDNIKQHSNNINNIDDNYDHLDPISIVSKAGEI